MPACSFEGICSTEYWCYRNADWRQVDYEYDDTGRLTQAYIGAGLIVVSGKFGGLIGAACGAAGGYLGTVLP